MSIINKIGKCLDDTFTPNKIVECSKYAKETINPTALRLSRGLSHFKGPEALLPVILVETFVTSGRTYQAQKRGGANEARERFIEQGTSALVWLFGVRTFNKIGDFIGKKIGLKDIEIDVGSDEVRNPFKKLVKDKKTATSVFKFGKIAGSIFLATGIVGVVIPKINIAITNKKLKEKRDKELAVIERGLTDMTSFMKNSKENPAFKGALNADTLRTLTNAFENNITFQLISQDAGIITGRAANARNKYEAFEYIFRDTVSIYFYMFCAKHLLSIFNGLTKNVDVHPQSAIETAALLIKKLEKYGTLSPDEFKNLALAKNEKNLENLFKVGEKNKKVVTLDEFKSFMGKDLTLEIENKAEKMTQLQPIRYDGKKLLTKMQVEDILSSKWTSDPEFLKLAISQATNGKSDRATKFVRQGDLEGHRIAIDKFVNSLIQKAQKQNKNIDAEFINNFVKKNVGKNSLFTGIGILVSGLMLALVVPKFQYLITERATGKNEFPGVTKY